MKHKKYKIFFFLFLLFNFLDYNLNYHFTPLNEKFSTFKDLGQELIDIQEYMDIIFNNSLIDGEKKFPLTNNPKISIIISVYNGEAFLNTSLLSIQNQDLKELEIIMVDDGSIDNSVNLIKELMIKEPRLILYTNDKNRGILYSKIKGILYAKGKYILLLDEDDIYVQRDAFSTLYKEAEINNLDLLGFRLLRSENKLKKIKYKRTRNVPQIIYQPELSELMFKHTSNGTIKKSGGLLTNYLIKKSN